MDDRKLSAILSHIINNQVMIMRGLAVGLAHEELDAAKLLFDASDLSAQIADNINYSKDVIL